MRKRLALLWMLVVLGIALALPASTLAGSAYTYRVLQNYCDGDEPNIKVRMIKPAGYYPDRFTITAQGQHRNIGGGSWSKEGAARTFSTNVPNQYARWTWTQGISWNPPDGNWHRIQLKLRVWSGGSVIASATERSVSC